MRAYRVVVEIAGTGWDEDDRVALVINNCPSAAEAERFANDYASDMGWEPAGYFGAEETDEIPADAIRYRR
jgi:hypothetical protein